MFIPSWILLWRSGDIAQFFFRGKWELLLNRARGEAAAIGLPVGATPSPLSAAQRAERAVKLAHLGEFSSARQALLAEPSAPAAEEILHILRDPSRGLQQPYGPMPREILQVSPLALDRTALSANIRCACKGANPPRKCSDPFSTTRSHRKPCRCRLTACQGRNHCCGSPGHRSRTVGARSRRLAARSPPAPWRNSLPCNLNKCACHINMRLLRGQELRPCAYLPIPQRRVDTGILGCGLSL